MRDLSPFVDYLVWAMESRGIMDTQAIYDGVRAYCERFSKSQLRISTMTDPDVFFFLMERYFDLRWEQLA